MRCYDGCPDGGLQRAIDGRARLMAEVRRREPDARLTWHAPHGGSAGGYEIHVWGRQLSGLRPTAEAALADAIGRVS